MTNAVIMGVSGGANSVKGTDDTFRVQKGKSVKKGDFLTFDYYREAIDNSYGSMITYEDDHGISNAFGSYVRRRFYYISGDSIYTETVVKNACDVENNGTHIKYPIVAIALQNGDSLQTIRVKKVSPNKYYTLTKNGVTYYSNSNNIPSAFKKVYEEALKRGLYGKELIDYINENYS